MWERLTWNTAMHAYNHLPNHYYRLNAMPAQLAWMFQAFAGGKPGPFDSWLPEWMRPFTQARNAVHTDFSPALIADVELAFKLDLLSQEALAALGPTRLRRAGAFKPN